MLKNLFHIPDTFDPDDRRRRQILNILLIIFIAKALTIIFLLQFVFHGGEPGQGSLISILLLILAGVSGILLVMNRSLKIPGWLNGAIFVALLILILSQVDSAQELFDGRSLVIWVLPIMIGALILRPGAVFVITAAIGALMHFLPPPGGVNYFVILELFTIAVVCWLGMSIANNAIRDARRQATNLQTIYDHVADGVLVLDLQGNFLSANPALLRMIPEQDLAKIIAAPLGKIVQWKRNIFSVSVSPVPEVGTVAIFRDETRRHETERARDALLATASHELRTPLTAVINYLELLQMLVKLGRLDTAEFKEHLTRAIENSQRLQRLVNDILDQAQIQAGVLELKPQAFNLRALLTKVHHLLDGLIQQKQLACKLEIASDVPEEITGDPERLHQVLVNLVGNAIKFTNQGQITINVSSPQKDTLSIEVADTGPGIPPEQLPDIFEAFRRGSNYAQRERQGAGLGLSIAKEIVTRMGGQLAAASQFGSGSTFTVILPIQAAYS